MQHNPCHESMKRIPVRASDRRARIPARARIPVRASDRPSRIAARATGPPGPIQPVDIGRPLRRAIDAPTTDSQEPRIYNRDLHCNEI